MASPVELPSGPEELGRFLRLADYNTRVVVLGVVLFGAAAGLLGVFLLLRRRTLLVDTLGHATLPGLGAAYLMALLLGQEVKQLPVLLAGAAATGFAAVAAVAALGRLPRVRPDAALAVVLSSSYGLGVVLLSIIQQTQGGNAAGLRHYLYGRTASMIASDAQWIAGVSLGAVTLTLLHLKELRLLCFDPEQAVALGLPVRRLELLLIGCTGAVAVVGLQAVGLILVVSLFAAPAAAARFWTRRLGSLSLVAAGMGAGCAWTGALLSAVFPRAPTGALIAVTASATFAFSLAFGTEQGLLRSKRRPA